MKEILKDGWMVGCGRLELLGMSAGLLNDKVRECRASEAKSRVYSG